MSRPRPSFKARAGELGDTVSELVAELAMPERAADRVDADDVAELERRWQEIEAAAPTIPHEEVVRWLATQVTQLLDDIHEFTRRKNPQPDEFYCLQPLVLVAREDGAYEVVDGQQRLTTILLVLRHFNERAAKKYQQTVYTLRYATRSDLDAFLEDPT